MESSFGGGLTCTIVAKDPITGEILQVLNERDYLPPGIPHVFSFFGLIPGRHKLEIFDEVCSSDNCCTRATVVSFVSLAFGQSATFVS